MLKNSTPKLREVIGGTETKIYCLATASRTCVLAVPRTIKLGLTKAVNRAKPLKYSLKKKSNFLSNEIRCSNYGHRPQYTDDTEAEEIEAYAQKRQVSFWWLLLPQRCWQQEPLQNFKHVHGLCTLTVLRKTEINSAVLQKKGHHAQISPHLSLDEYASHYMCGRKVGARLILRPDKIWGFFSKVSCLFK